MIRTYPRLTLLAVLAALPLAASAELSTSAFFVTATNAQGTATYEVLSSSLTYDVATDTFSWALSGPIELRSTTGDLIGTLNSASLFYIQDPVVNLSFNATAGGSATTFGIQSGLLSFATISPAEGRATAGMSITDNNNDGVSASGNLNDSMYQAHYNGFLGAGTSFTTLIGNFNAGSGQTGTNSGTFGWAALASVSDMSARWNFDLSAFDQAAGTSNWETRLVPEPATMSVLGLGLLALIRRRKQK